MRSFFSAVAVFASVCLSVGTSEAGNVPKNTRYRGPVFINRAQAQQNWTVPEICAAYNFPTKLTGGAVIGIAEYGGGYVLSDLALFSKTYMNGTPINITAISVDGGTNNPSDPSGADFEVTLDIEIAAAAYYYCTGKAPTIKVFFGNPNGDFVVENANVIAAAAAAGCDVLSISWGDSENHYSNAEALMLETAAINATAKGLTILAASGDGDGSDQRNGETDGLNHLLLPSSCPHVIAVGGTTKTSGSEVVWNNLLTLGTPYPLGTGGGYSTVFPVQSWQVGAPKAPITNNGTGRMVPDVAANADPDTPYFIAIQGSIQAAGNGTSAATPLWAGLIASTGKKLGYITPTFWLAKNRTAFKDITSGNNILFTALVGPDACTGIGAPIGTSINTVINPPVVVPTRTPSNVTAVYNSTTKTLTLTGDDNANSLTVSYKAGVLTIEGANSTSVNNASVPLNISLSSQLVLVANMNGGDDAISFIGINSSTSNITLGAGNDTAAFSLCGIATMTIDGGTGVNTLLTTTSSIDKLTETNFP